MYVPRLGVRVGDPRASRNCAVRVPRDTLLVGSLLTNLPPYFARLSHASSVASLTHGPARGKCSVHLPAVASTVAGVAARTAAHGGQPASKRAAPAGKPPPPKAAVQRKASKGSAVLRKGSVPSPSARKGSVVLASAMPAKSARRLMSSSTSSSTSPPRKSSPSATGRAATRSSTSSARRAARGKTAAPRASELLPKGVRAGRVSEP